MRAARIYGKRDVRIEEVEVANVKENQAKVRVDWAGICGSDLHAYTHPEGLLPMSEPHPLSGRMLPLTLGHEFSGTVVEIGASVKNVAIGDRVAIEPNYYCGECLECKTGKYNICRNSNAAFLGLSGDGGFAEFCVTESFRLHILPEGVSQEEGALVEPTAVAYHGVVESGMKIGDRVLITGAGPIGLLTIQCALAAGATKIFVSDISEERLEIARKMGATHTLNPMKIDVIETIMKETNDDGVEVTFEAAGVVTTINTAIQATKRSGTILILALFMEPVEMDLFTPLAKELTIKPTLAYANEFPQVIELMETKRIDVLPVVTSKTTLDHVVSDGLEKLLVDKSQAKILLRVE